MFGLRSGVCPAASSVLLSVWFGARRDAALWETVSRVGRLFLSKSAWFHLSEDLVFKHFLN